MANSPKYLNLTGLEKFKEKCDATYAKKSSETDITGLQAALGELSSDVEQNTSNIADNTSDISDIQASVSTLETSINTLERSIANVFEFKGNIASPDSSLLTEANVGNVYNVTNAFSPSDSTNFVPGTEGTYPAGTNIVVVNTGDATYLFEVLAGNFEVVVDSALSTTSINPVQNKVVNTAISAIQSQVDRIEDTVDSFGDTYSTIGHTHNYAGSSSAGGAANSVKSNLVITFDSGTTEGTNKFTFNGSTAKTINFVSITDDEINGLFS